MSVPFLRPHRRGVVMLVAAAALTMLFAPAASAAPAGRAAPPGDLAAADVSNCFVSPSPDTRAICATGGAITSAATGKYLTVAGDATLNVTGTVHGWFQNVEFVFLPDFGWPCDWWSLTLSAPTKLASGPNGGGVIRADSTFIGWNQAFSIQLAGSDGAGKYYSIKHLASDRFLTAYSDGRLRADSTFVGWNQAFRIPALDGYYDFC
jgi:hypothetical protein